MKNKNFIGRTFDNYFSNVTKTEETSKFWWPVSFWYYWMLIDNESAIKVKEKCNNQENSFSFSLCPTKDFLK